MYKKILVALDRSEMHESVFNQALTLAKATDATLMLLHVLSEQEEGSPEIAVDYSYYSSIVTDTARKLYRQQWDTFQQQGLELLQNLGRQAKAANVSTEWSQLYGSPGHKICDLAKNWNADLIMMGRRGHSGFKELFLGSVSNYVVHHAGCSVLVVQPAKPTSEMSQHSQLNTTQA